MRDAPVDAHQGRSQGPVPSERRPAASPRACAAASPGRPGGNPMPVPDEHAEHSASGMLATVAEVASPRRSAGRRGPCRSPPLGRKRRLSARRPGAWKLAQNLEQTGYTREQWARRHNFSPRVQCASRGR
eukprot:gnl/Chilomastix_cuspidata/5062.p4 GENE.gnl/Chilomastix_cuspidata/5062~~gnl/Chilomastix_cuspidata/5062.p4  ORF type:complete len:130 (+),score=10.53 gnl/Chilomastix_cuspidata/5062:285-674(+)